MNRAQLQAEAFTMNSSSMNTSLRHGGHSAQVTMRLLVNGGSVAIAQMGPDFLLVDAPINHSPSNARLVLQVDQSERRWDVHLPNGVSKSSKRIAIAVREQPNRYKL